MCETHVYMARSKSHYSRARALCEREFEDQGNL